VRITGHSDHFSELRVPNHYVTLGRVCGLVASLTLTTSCSGTGEAAGGRTVDASNADGEVVIGVAWPWATRTNLLFGQGIDLAIEEINAAGGVRGRKLRTLRVDDRESVDQGRLVAQELTKNPAVIAVIGHLQSYVTIPAAAAYDLSGLVLIAPTATSPELTRKGYRRVFRTTFNDAEVGRQMAEYAIRQGYKRMTIYYSRDEYGRGLANAFEEAAVERNTRILDRRSYDSGLPASVATVAPIADTWVDLNPDAVFVAGESSHLITVAAELRKRGLRASIIGGDILATPKQLHLKGAPLDEATRQAVEGVVMATAFNTGVPTPEAQRFVAAFRTRYGFDPDVAAALAYDAVHVLATAMAKPDELSREALATAMRGLREWSGVTGKITFSPTGELMDFPIRKVIVHDAMFRHLEDAVPTAARGAATGALAGRTP
jgi:branched-chain amino acid transport system substrate-binding protein